MFLPQSNEFGKTVKPSFLQEASTM